MFADYHIHTEYSDDSTELIENIVKQGIILGLDELCFTDHVDYGVKYDVEEGESDAVKQAVGKRLLNVNYSVYFRHIEKLQSKYQNCIQLKKGLEFGIQTHTIPRYQKLFDTYELDFVLLSCHQVENQEFWTYEFQKGRTQDEYFARYYQEIYDCIKEYKDYSVLSHLDMLQRYTKPRFPFEKSKDFLTDILNQVIKDGKGIEVNTSSFSYKLPDLMPERNILRLYHDLGGKIITVGSDCHQASRLGDHIPEIYQELKEIGFTHFCTFTKMEPIYHQL